MSTPERHLTQLEDPAPHEVAGFCCNDAADLRAFLLDDALTYVRLGLARVYLGWQEGLLVGFFSLSCGLVRYEELSKQVRTTTELGDVGSARTAPVILLGRLAVDDRLRKQGIGSWLFDEAVSLAKFSVAPHVGCRFLLVDAMYERMDWYEKRGCFVLGQVAMPPSTTRMAFDLRPADH